jgi:hypothetical protein
VVALEPADAAAIEAGPAAAAGSRIGS